MRESVPAPDNEPKPPADVAYRPHTGGYSEQDRRKRKVNKEDAQRILSKRKRKRKQERHNKKAGNRT